ncbi:hypothetical protein H6G96_31075 [Nostoc sp. FACHB-892]|uniref:hypothetical protein n=1 Tax=Nostoc sp. FACHB-892 TaxID=2692843 RepID=UPI001684CB02|nr:hypothetical protein [Nostoc sp. FACHB-892]MBD2730642.1 hypothetical protein [Nostoc sp. FACHB-892]
MQKLSIAITKVAFIALGIISVQPVQAALIDFNFSTRNGATGTFTLNTDTPPSPEPAIFRPNVTGVAYLGAVSNFSISAPYVNLSNVTTDFDVVPSVTSDLIGFPKNLGVLSGVSYPPGCITSSSLTCLFDIALFYSGNQTELPILSDNPLSYSRGVGIDFFNPTTNELLIRDNIANFKVVSKQVPESNSGLSILASAIGIVGLLIKRNLDTKRYAQ